MCTYVKLCYALHANCVTETDVHTYILICKYAEQKLHMYVGVGSCSEPGVLYRLSGHLYGENSHSCERQ